VESTCLARARPRPSREAALLMPGEPGSWRQGGMDLKWLVSMETMFFLMKFRAVSWDNGRIMEHISDQQWKQWKPSMLRCFFRIYYPSKIHEIWDFTSKV